ncbi:MAG TPA: type VI secretion system baseplate subunit TssK [Candidatus Sulfotelmatobacter sp.]|nr:type VI secretion system baseplate subunit TssK [Candidatus Sulfotelmatobacter sp.]
MSKPQKVVWTKGMFLMPQHFQVQDEYFEQTLHFRATASNFANWGLRGIGVDEASLENGLFTLRHCEGVLPDGLTFEMPVADELPAGRQVEEFFPPLQETLDVYLAIPQLQPSAKNYSIGTKSGETNNGHVPTRYVADTRMAIDSTMGSDEKAIQVGRKSFRLLFGGENLDGFTAMRIAQIGRNSTGAYVLAAGFIPPLLDISASDYLMTLARRQVEVLTAKSSSLGLNRRQKGRDVADFTTAEVAGFWLLHTINSYLPELKHVWKIRRGHPDVLYCAMLRLAGALSTFAFDADARDFPDYDHDNLGPCFTALDKKVRDLLETVIKTKCIAIPLQLTDKLVWSGRIADERHLKDSQFILSVSTRIPVDELITKLPRLAKVSAPDDVNRLVRNSLPGVVLRHLPSPPSAVPPKLDNQYFSMVQSGPLWDGIVQSRVLSIFVPGEIADPKMELLIVLP